MFNCMISTVPAHTQRYDTIGDWWFRSDGTLLDIRISDCRDWKCEVLVAFHELIEAVLCQTRGISQNQVDAWDKEHSDLDEPGADPSAPYYNEHMFAEGLERQLCAELGLSWGMYSRILEEHKMAPKIGSKDSKAKAIPGTATTPKDACVTEGVKGTNTNAKYSDEAPIPGTVGKKRGGGSESY